MFHIFHHFDADGYASAAVIIRAIMQNGAFQREHIQTYSCSHSKAMDFSVVKEDTDIVYIVDYSFSNEIDKKNILDMIDRGIDITWIDHHKTSDDIINSDERFKKLAEAGLVDTRNIYSGAMLSWLFMYNKKDDNIGIDDYIAQNCPIWIQYVSDYDTWTHKLPHSTDFVQGVELNEKGLYGAFIDPEGSYSTYVSKNVDGITNTYIKEGQVVNRYRKLLNKKAVQNDSFEIILKEDWENNGVVTPYKFLAVNGHGNSLVFGDDINMYDAVILFFFNGDKWIYSIYSKNEESALDVSIIAKFYGEKYGISGGGHHHAAGWVTLDCMIDDYGTLPYKERTLFSV